MLLGSHENSFCTESSYPYKAIDGTFQEYSSNGVPYMEELKAMYQRFFGTNREVWADQAQPLCCTKEVHDDFKTDDFR